MARKTSIDTLPKAVRDWLNSALSESGFSGYQALETLMREKGYAISKSAIHRYGQKIERRMAAIKASTEAAKLLTEAAGDEGDARSEAVIALVQTEMFESILAIQESEDEDVSPADRLGLMSAAAKNIATLARASIHQKEFKTKVMARAQEVAEKVARLASKGGLSADSIAEIRKSVLGIAS